MTPRLFDGAKVYIGDAVYLARRGDDLVLTTEDGVAVTNRIVLEPAVFEALLGAALEPAVFAAARQAARALAETRP